MHFDFTKLTAEFTKDTFAGLSFDELQIKYDLEARQAAQAKIEEFRFFLDQANERVRKEKEELSSNGVTILVTDRGEGEVVFVNLAGTIDLARIGELGDSLDVPGLDELKKGEAGPGEGR